MILVLFINCGNKKISNKNTRIDIAPIDITNKTIWPGNEWKTREPGPAGMNTDALKKLDKWAFTLSENQKERKGIRTDGLLVIKNGMIVFEKYGRGYTKDNKHLAWSVTKSFVNALVGIAVQEEKLNLDMGAWEKFPILNQPDKKAITIRHLLNMSSGLYWQEDYEYSPLKSTVVAMLYTRGRQDMASFAASRNMRYPPGTNVYYSSGDTNILMGLLKNTLSKDEYQSWPWDKLFDRIGMKDVTWERDASGSFVGSSYIYATPRDLARFGYLYATDGVWKGQRILPVGWVDFTRTPAPAHATTPVNDKNLKYQKSAQWYTNLNIPKTEYTTPWPDAPKDTFAATGHWGQYIFVIPSLELVVVRTGDDRDGSFDINEFLKLVKESAQ